MPIHFEPKTEEELSCVGLLPNGIYAFKIIDAIEKTSSSGNEMIQLKLSINLNKNHYVIYDYLIALEKMQYKIKHFTDSVGLHEKYNTGILSAQDCINMTGDVKVETEEVSGYSPRNKVVDYVVSENYSDKDNLFYDDPMCF